MRLYLAEQSGFTRGVRVLPELYKRGIEMGCRFHEPHLIKGALLGFQIVNDIVQCTPAGAPFVCVVQSKFPMWFLAVLSLSEH